MANKEAHKVPINREHFLEVLKARGYSVRKLGEAYNKIQRTEKTIRRYLTAGEMPPDLLERIARYIYVSPEYLAGRGVEKRNAIDIQISDFIDSNHLNSLWYGGHVATITLGQLSIDLDAVGDVCADLLFIDDNKARHIYVKDKNNAGEFFGEMSSKIRGDDDLISLLQSGELSLDSGNWWEIFVDYKGEHHDIGEVAVLNADNMNDAISEIMNMLDWLMDSCK